MRSRPSLPPAHPLAPPTSGGEDELEPAMVRALQVAVLGDLRLEMLVTADAAGVVRVLGLTRALARRGRELGAGADIDPAPLQLCLAHDDGHGGHRSHQWIVVDVFRTLRTPRKGSEKPT